MEVRPFLLVVLAVTLGSFAPQARCAVEPDDIESNLETLQASAKSALKPGTIEAFKTGPSKFRDYQCFCRLYTKKGNAWRDVGGADYAYRYRDLFKAVIQTKDYRNGSVICREPSGSIRGSGGGSLRFMKMNLHPDSRTLSLPTGYSLAKCDFLSLYDALKDSLSRGASGFTSSGAVNLKMLNDPVTVLVLKEPDGDDLKELVLINPKNKTPILWTTFKNGQIAAMISFEKLQLNQGLDEDFFKL